MDQHSPIKIFHTNLNPSQKIEDDFFASEKSMCSVKELHKQIFWKARSVWLFEEIINKYKLEFSGNVLELAGGYGMHAAYLKNRFKNKINLYYSDSSLTAVKTSTKFENFFNTKIDEKWIIEAEKIPTQGNAFNQIFFFAGFHHIQNPNKSIAECYRVLKNNGKLYLLLEPSCPKVFNKLFKKHTDRNEIQEKNYTRSEYKKLLHTQFQTIKQYNFTGYYNRESRRSLVYYFFLSLMPNWLTKLFPCSQVIIAIKNQPTI